MALAGALVGCFGPKGGKNSEGDCPHWFLVIKPKFSIQLPNLG